MTPEQKPFNIIAYRFFNKIDTFEDLFGGPLCPQAFDFVRLERRLDKAKSDANIFNNAYLVSSHNYNASYRPGEKHIQILMVLRDIAPNMSFILNQLQSVVPADAPNVITRNIPLVGGISCRTNFIRCNICE